MRPCNAWSGRCCSLRLGWRGSCARVCAGTGSTEQREWAPPLHFLSRPSLSFGCKVCRLSYRCAVSRNVNDLPTYSQCALPPSPQDAVSSDDGDLATSAKVWTPRLPQRSGRPAHPCRAQPSCLLPGGRKGCRADSCSAAAARPFTSNGRPQRRRAGHRRRRGAGVGYLSRAPSHLRPNLACWPVTARCHRRWRCKRRRGCPGGRYRRTSRRGRGRRSREGLARVTAE